VKEASYVHISFGATSAELKANKGELKVALTPYSTQRKQGAIERMERLEGLFAEGRFGEVLKIGAQLRNETLLSEADRERAHSLCGKAQLITRRWLSLLEDLGRQLEDEPRTEVLEAARALARRLEEAYEKSSAERERAAWLLARGEAAYKKAVEQRSRDKLDGLVKKAEDFVNKGLVGHALLVVRHILTRYPTTTQAGAARILLQRIEHMRRTP